MTKEKIVIGFYEDVLIDGKVIRAKIDTGAGVSSIDSSLADAIKVGPVIGRAAVVNTHGRAVRPVVMLKVEIGGKTLDAKFNIAIREHLRYPILIGKNILRQGFIIDPKKRLKKNGRKTIKKTQDLQSQD
ncbi:hypothetical protein HOF78_03830 [Candidatus Woesearchaeota archaeon]|jgi:hypothetical protein|nr:hypothetical protein [Candidatus Woesearchaeota archaeon]MBT6044726.1 hypothetical protein [Candidatus Woesearchaeota archaeon]